LGHVLTPMLTPKRRARPLVGLVTLAIAVTVAGCSPASGDRAGSGGSASPAVAPPTPFSGPWAELLTMTYGDVSPVEREALEDGVIDEQEYAYFQDRMIECVSDLGVEASFSDGSTLDYSNPDAVSEDLIDGCLADHGIKLLTASDAISRNPENLDEATIMVECLQRAGLVGRDYTPDDYDEGIDLASLADDEDFEACLADPLADREG
jgi:hypothetical protein